MTIHTKQLPSPRKSSMLIYRLSRSRVVRAYHRLPRFAQRVLAVFLMFAIIFPFYLFGPFHKDTKAAWFNEDWRYRQKSEISNSGSNQTDFQVMITLDTETLISAGKMRGDCNDIRVTDISGRLLPYWVADNSCNTTTSRIWTKVPSIETSGATVYVYYGNLFADNAEKPDEVFLAFDDFKTDPNTNGKWNINRANGDATTECVSDTSGDGLFYLTDATANRACLIRLVNDIDPTSYIAEFRYKVGPGGGADGMSFAFNHDFSALSSSSTLETGGYLGLAYTTTTTTDGYAVLVDGFDNGTNDPSGDYIGISRTNTYSGGYVSTANSATSAAEDNKFHIVSTSITASNVDYVKLDDSSLITSTAITNTGNTNIGFGGGTGGATNNHILDYVLIRSYASTEPSAGTPSGEEQGPGPIAQWRLDEGYGTTAHDSSIFGNDATITNATWQQNDLCLNGKCLYFDGSGDYASVADQSTLAFTALDSTTDVSGSSITSGSISPTANSLLLVYSVGRKGSDPGVPTASDTLTGTGAWAEAGGSSFEVTNGGDTRVAIHYAQVGSSPGSGTVTINYATSMLNMSVDIIEVTGFDTTTPIVQYATNGYFGPADRWIELQNFSNPHNAAIGFWNQSQITQTATQGSGFTELVDTSHIDDAGSDHQVEIESKVGETTSIGITWSVTDPSMGYGLEIAADTSGSNTFDFGASDSFTVGGWFKHSAQSSGQDVIFAKYETTGSDGGYKLLMESDGDLTFGIDDDNSSFPAASVSSTAATYDDYQWHHVSAVKNSTTSITLYIDGQQIAQNSSISGVGTLANDDPLYIGIDGDGSSNAWLGFLDDLKVYNYARSASEIKADFDAQGGSIGAGVVAGAKSQSYLSSGLEGYWKLDETTSWTNDCSTTSVTDSSGNGNNGTACPATTGPTGTDTGKFGNGGTLDASDDYLSAADSASLSPTSAVSIAAWVSPTTSVATKAIVVKDGSYRLVTDGSGDPLCQVHNGSSWQTAATSSTAIATGSWQHVACSYDGNNIRVFVNGELTGSSAVNVSIADTANALEIGKDSGGTYGLYDGTIDEIRVYSRAFTAKEVRDLYNFAAPPIGYWDFNENTGTTTVYDKGTGANDGTMTGSMTESDWVPGKFGSALNFDGSNDYITLGDVLNNVSLPVTAEAWVNTSGGGTYGIFTRDDNIVSGPNNSGSYYGFWLNIESNNTLAMSYGDGTGSGSANRRSKISSTTVPTDTWTHIVGVIRGATDMDLYINGVDAGGSYSGSAAGSMASTTYPVRIGVHGRNGTYLTGSLDEVKVYDYARTQKQVIEDMNAGHPAGGSPIGSQAGYWKFDEGHGTTANNTITSGNNGTISGATWVSGSTCKVDRCLDFAGAGYVEVSGLIDSSATAMTLTAWVDLDTADTLGSEVISLGDHVALRLDDTQGTPDYGVNGFYYTGSAWNVTETNETVAGTGWHYVAYVTDPSNSTQSVYIDGRLAGSSTFSDTISFSGLGSNTEIGRHGNGVTSQDFDGRIDEVKVYTGALTKDEILVDMNYGSALSASVGQIEAADLSDGAGAAPIGQWEFDENTGTSSTADIGSGQNDGTLNSITESSWVPGKFGSALNLDGSADYVSVGATSDLNMSASNVSISVWVNSTSTSASEQLIFEHDVWPATGTYQLTTNSANQLALDFVGATNLNYSVDWTDGTWHHIVAMMDDTNNTMSIYFDGKFAASRTETASIGSSSAASYIGSRNGASRFLNGTIDDLRVYNYVLSPAQISYLFNRGAPVAHWKLDECSGTTAYDSAPKANASASRVDGTLSIGATGSNTTAGTCTSPTDGSGAWYDGQTGKFNSSLDLDGTDDFITTSASSPLAISGKTFTTVSWGGWFYPKTSAASETLIEKASSLRLTTDASSQPVCGIFYSAAFHDATAGSSALTLNAWNHIQCTYDGTNIKTYLNGTLVGTTSETNSITASSSIIYLGENSSAGQRFEGQIDDIQLYNYSLSAAQILKIMNQNAAVRFGPATGSP